MFKCRCRVIDAPSLGESRLLLDLPPEDVSLRAWREVCHLLSWPVQFAQHLIPSTLSSARITLIALEPGVE